MQKLIKQLLEGKTLRIIAYAYPFFIITIMLIPTSGASKLGIPYLDKLFHFALYFLFQIIWTQLIFDSKKTASTEAVYYLAFVLFIYGIVIEVLQEFITSTRSFEYWDILANSIGLIVALLASKSFFKNK